MMADFKGAYIRASAMSAVGCAKEKIAQFLNAEFFMTFYVSNGKLWTQFRNERGEFQSRVVLS